MQITEIPFQQALDYALKSGTSFDVRSGAKSHGEALNQAVNKPVQWAGLRHSSETTTQRVVRNDLPERNQSSLEDGAMCEVLVDGHFGYAATADLSQ